MPNTTDPIDSTTKRRCNRTRRLALLILAATLVPTYLVNSAAHAATYWVGAGPGCDFDNIFVALAFAGGTEVDDVVRLTDDISGINLILYNWDSTGTQGALTIDGGFPSCGAPRGIAATTRAVLTGNSAGPVITVSAPPGGRSFVELRNLELRDAPDHRGLLVDGGEAELHNVVIENNEGGVEVRDGELDASASVTIQGNQTPGIGGGIYCFGGEVRFRGAIQLNEALGGGGIYAVAGCRVELEGAEVSWNEANLGAGAYVSGAETSLSSADFSSTRPVTVFEGNEAFESGGGVYADEGALLTMSATWFLGNTSEEDGSAITVDGSTLRLEPSLERPCSPHSGGGCNRFTSNRTEGSPDRASVIHVHDSFADIRQVVFRDNETIDEGFGTLISSFGSSLFLENAVLANNRVSNLLFQIDGSTAARFVSAAGNRATDTAENGARIGFIASAAETAFFHLQSSVLPGHLGLTVTNSSPTADCVIARSLFGFTDVRSLETDVETGLFVDAPAGDLRLLPDAVAVDYCDVGSARGAIPDIEGNPRPSDVSNTPNLHGAFDLGAFESLMLFADGFESGNTSAWSSGG